MFQRVGQPLVDLGGWPGEAALERHCQAGANQVDALLALPHAGAGVPLVPEDAGLQVNPLRAAGLLCCGLQQAEGRPETPGRAQMCRCREAFSGRVRRCIGCRKCRSGAFSAGQRLFICN